MAPRKLPKTKIEVIRRISDDLSVSQTLVTKVLEDFVRIAYINVQENKSFHIPGIGKLLLITRQARKAYNPRLKKDIFVPPRQSISFRVSKSARAAILPPDQPKASLLKEAAGKKPASGKKTPNAAEKTKKPAPKTSKKTKA